MVENAERITGWDHPKATDLSSPADGALIYVEQVFPVN